MARRGDREPVQPDPELVSDDLTGTVLRGAGLSGIGHALAQLLTLGFYLALARLATPEDFGQFAAAAIVINAGLLFIESGMLAALIQRRDRVDEAASTAVFSTALGGILFSLLALAASPLIGLIFDSSRIATLAAAVSGLLLLRSLQVVPEALLQRRFSFLRRMVIEPLQVVAFGVAAVIAASDDLGPWALVIGYYAAATTDVLLSWLLVRWRPKPGLASFAMWKELIAYARHVLASNVVLRLGEQIPILLIGRYVGAAPLGQYRYADRIAHTPFSLLLSAASYVILPAFARISHDRARFAAAFQQALRWFSTVTMPLGLILVPLGISLAVVAFGEVWRDAGEAAMALAPFVVAAALINLVSEALKAEGRPEILIRIHAVTVIAGAIAMVAMLGWELVGVAAGVSAGVLVGAAYALARLGDILEIPPREMAAQIWPPAVASVAMAAILLPVDRILLDPPSHSTAVGVLLLGAESLAALAIYMAVLVPLAPDTIGRLRELLSTARRRRAPAPEAISG
jgi:O-antigen/teichoic acid export membrane protein